MKIDKSSSSMPAREQTDKRLRAFLAARKFNFLQEKPQPVSVKRQRCVRTRSGA